MGFQPDGLTTLDKQAKKEPAWITKALEQMSPPDRATIEKLRNSFENRQQSGNWYYAAAGYDITPLLLAPEGSTLHFVDPGYTNEGSDGLLRDLETSFLRASEDVTHVDATHLQTELEGDVTIRWVGESANNPDTVPSELDVIFTNNISMRPPAQAVDNLRIGGVLLIDAAKSRIPQVTNHPARLINISDLDFKPLTESPIRVDNLQMADVGNLMQYKNGGPETFTALEKTRDFTDEELLEMRLSDYCEDIFNRIAFRSLPIAYEGTEHESGYMSDLEVLMEIQGRLTELTSFIEQQPNELQVQAKQKLREHLGKHFSDDIYTTIDWVTKVPDGIEAAATDGFTTDQWVNYAVKLRPFADMVRAYLQKM